MMVLGRFWISPKAYMQLKYGQNGRILINYQQMILNLLIAIALLELSSAGKLPIQAHSFNDFNYLQNLINKDIDYFKLDVSMANRKSCQSYSTWNKTKKCYKSPQYVQQICCLAFRGDASSRPNFQFQFNTSDQYIQFMENNLAQIVTYQPKRKLLFAINFQYDHSFNDFITEQFLAALSDLMNKYQHNLLLGTGSDSFILEYDRICYGKGAPQCNDIRRKISKSNMFLQSGSSNPFDPRDYYKRYRNFNIYFKGIQEHCQNGFPQWISKYPQFPLIFWQPSNQKQIQYVLQRFLSPNCMKRHGRNISGMAIATNIDPEMFDVYTKNIIQSVSSSHSNLQLNEPLSAPVQSFSYLSQKLFLAEQLQYRLAKQVQGQTQVIFSVSVNSYLTDKLLLQCWQSDLKNKTIKLVASRSFSALIGESDKLDTLWTDGVGHIILITSNPSSPGNTIYYFDNTTLQLVSFKKWQKIYGSYMRKDELIYVTCTDSSLVNCSIIGSRQLKQTIVYANFFANLFLRVITSLQQYEGGFIVVGSSSSVNDLAVGLIIREGKVVAPEIPLSLGQNPKIFKKQVGKQYGVLLQNGMCHSALLINNNDMNKCNFFVQPQFNSLRNVRGLVSLLEFDLQDLLKNREPVSPCHPKLQLTKIMNGVNSDILQLGSLGSYLIVGQYLRIEEQDLMGALFCGGSNFDKKFQYRQKSSLMTTMFLNNKNVDLVRFEEE